MRCASWPLPSPPSSFVSDGLSLHFFRFSSIVYLMMAMGSVDATPYTKTAARDHHQNQLRAFFPVTATLSLSCFVDSEISSAFAAAARLCSSTPLPIALVDLAMVSPVEFLSPEAPSESFCPALPIREEMASPAALETPAAPSDSLRDPSLLAAEAVSEARLTAFSPAFLAARCVPSRVSEAALCAFSVAFLALSRTAEEALVATVFVVCSAAALEDSRADAAVFLTRSRNDEDEDEGDDGFEGRLLLSPGGRRRVRVVE